MNVSIPASQNTYPAVVAAPYNGSLANAYEFTVECYDTGTGGSCTSCSTCTTTTTDPDGTVNPDGTCKNPVQSCVAQGSSQVQPNPSAPITASPL